MKEGERDRRRTEHAKHFLERKVPPPNVTSLPDWHVGGVGFLVPNFRCRDREKNSNQPANPKGVLVYVSGAYTDTAIFGVSRQLLLLAPARCAHRTPCFARRRRLGAENSHLSAGAAHSFVRCEVRGRERSRFVDVRCVCACA